MTAKLIALVIPLGLDTFAVAAALRMLGSTRATRVRISILFPAFEAAMPLIGPALGAPLGRAIGESADYVAIAVLLAFGLYTLVGSEEREERAIGRLADARGPGVLLLGLSISLDELAIGLHPRTASAPRRAGDRADRRPGGDRHSAWAAPRQPSRRATTRSRRTPRRPRPHDARAYSARGKAALVTVGAWCPGTEQHKL